MRPPGDLLTSTLRRIAVVHNVDYRRYPPGSPSYDADAEVERTAEAVSEALRGRGHDASIVTVDDSLDGIAEDLASPSIDCVFNLVESLGGDARREVELPRCLDRAGIPYTGNPADVLMIAHAKDRTREVLRERGIAIPRGLVVERDTPVPDIARAGMFFPVFVKPARTDASIGIDQGSIAYDASLLARRLKWLREILPPPYLVEEYLPGREVNVAIFPDPVMGRSVCTEVDFSSCPEGVAPIVTYDCKWTPSSPEYAARSVASKGRLSDAKIAEAQALARAAFLAIGGKSYGRVDLRADRDERFKVIDVNPNPDIHPEAGLAIAARSEGVDYDALVIGVIESALSRSRDASSTHTEERSTGARRSALTD